MFPTHDPLHAFRTRATQLLLQALALGLLACILLPAARGHVGALGWLPLWLVGAPLAALSVLWRHTLFARLSAARARILVPGPGRRRPFSQARRLRA